VINDIWGSSAGGWDADEVISVQPGGRWIAAYNENNPRGAYFQHPDVLGTFAAWTSSTGAQDLDDIYYPWGQLWQGATADVTRFAGMEHRNYMGFDVTPNREYNSNWGRWLTPDPGGKNVVRLDDPQTWNMYAYTRNNFTTLTDPSGLLAPAGGADPFESTHVYTGTIESIDQGDERPAGEKAQNAGTVATQTFGTEQEAAKAAEKAALAATVESENQYEYGGLILKDKKGRFRYTLAIRGSDAAHFLHGPPPPAPKGFAAVALYHTHPDVMGEGLGLSAGDEGWALRYDMTIYEADTSNGELYHFTPHVTPFKKNEVCCGVIGDDDGRVP
jgi:RHS repeat-associated protein